MQSLEFFPVMHGNLAVTLSSLIEPAQQVATLRAWMISRD